jgi:hypothetical protein
MEKPTGLESSREKDAALRTPLTATLLVVITGLGFLLYQAWR